MATDRNIHLLTAEGERLSGQPWNVYPRPQLQRDSFLCLNGEWEFAVTDHTSQPTKYTETILVPFPPQSTLSGICRAIPKKSALWYRTVFTLPDGFVQDRVLLHIGAADQMAAVFVNGKRAGNHIGGYQPFTFDITNLLEAENTLTICVTDPQGTTLPYGKQREKRGGMWYTPISGIWQTVWLESVPAQHVEKLRIDTTADTVSITAVGVSEGEITVQTPDGALTALLQNGTALLRPENPRLWSPEDPYLYHFTLTAGADTVHSYFAMRTVNVRTIHGVPRICLNGKPYFFHGLLDQGYFSDGIYTPASPKNYENDILSVKSIGFNTLRKHIKVEPEVFYYDCDRLGMLVWQDMVNNGDYSFVRDTALPTAGLKTLRDTHLHRDPKTRRAFLEHMDQTVEQLHNHPSVVYWTIFNEGWGQFDSETVYRRLRSLDSSRIIDTASGWFKGASSDVESEHVYFKPYRFAPADKPVVLSEFGGYSYKPEGHVFNLSKTYGYRFFKEREAFEAALIQLYENEIIPAVSKGLCGCILTQLSDVEDETNGLFSYDRKVTKVSAEAMRTIASKIAENMK